MKALRSGLSTSDRSSSNVLNPKCGLYLNPLTFVVTSNHFQGSPTSFDPHPKSSPRFLGSCRSRTFPFAPQAGQFLRFTHLAGGSCPASEQLHFVKASQAVFIGPACRFRLHPAAYGSGLRLVVTHPDAKCQISWLPAIERKAARFDPIC
jgi:hypothetical protein